MGADLKHYSIPEDLMFLIDSTLKFYASGDTYLGRRTGGIMKGCPRGSPAISEDHGKYALDCYSKLSRLYPLKDAPAPEGGTWVSAEDWLPDVHQLVIAFTNKYGCLLADRTTSNPDHGWSCDGKVTHWMQIPNGPTPQNGSKS